MSLQRAERELNHTTRRNDDFTRFWWTLAKAPRQYNLACWQIGLRGGPSTSVALAPPDSSNPHRVGHTNVVGQVPQHQFPAVLEAKLDPSNLRAGKDVDVLRDSDPAVIGVGRDTIAARWEMREPEGAIPTGSVKPLITERPRCGDDGDLLGAEFARCGFDHCPAQLANLSQQEDYVVLSGGGCYIC
ncbi:MAG: hypothetical protein AB1486_21465 [Planctomycetota bacterium]